jgi:hypothetical protein
MPSATSPPRKTTLRSYAPRDPASRSQITDRLLSYGTRAHTQSVDTVKETVELVEARQLSASEIASRLPSNEPRFVFFRWSHTHNGGAGPVRLESNGMLAFICYLFIYCFCRVLALRLVPFFTLLV